MLLCRGMNPLWWQQQVLGSLSLPAPTPNFRGNPGPAPVCPREHIFLRPSVPNLEGEEKTAVISAVLCIVLGGTSRMLSWYFSTELSISHLLTYSVCFLLSYEHGYSGNCIVILHMFWISATHSQSSLLLLINCFSFPMRFNGFHCPECYIQGLAEVKPFLM